MEEDELERIGSIDRVVDMALTPDGLAVRIESGGREYTTTMGRELGNGDVLTESALLGIVEAFRAGDTHWQDVSL